MKFATIVLSMLVAATAITWAVSGEREASAVAGFSFLVSLASAYAAVCALFLIVNKRWAPPLVQQALPVSFLPLVVGIVLTVPAVMVTATFERPHLPWFSDVAIGTRAAVGAALLLGLAWLAWYGLGRRTAVVFAICFILYQSAFSWDFGMTLQPHWHDTILAPFWIVGSVLAGMCLFTLFCSTRITALKLQPEDFDRFGCFLLAFSLLHGYLLYAQIITVWYGNLPSEVDAMNARYYGAFSTLFWTIVAVTIAAPVLLLIFRPLRRSYWSCGAIAGAVLLGLWLERLWIILPARHLTH